MTPQVTSAGLEWLSFHVFLGDAWRPFLAFYFFPALDTEFASGHIKRFFFIQYSQGGLHLRMRFLPARDLNPEIITSWTEELIRRFRQERNLPLEQCFLEQHRYDRSDLYFGETIASVYAELLNEQTSYLALQFLAGPGGSRSQVLVKLLCALYIILEKVARDRDELRSLAAGSRQFATNAIKRLGLPPSAETDEMLETQLCEALLLSLPKTAKALENNQAVRGVIRMLRKLRRSPRLYESVGHHALHLFCNKVGISLADEQYLFSSLSRLVAGD